MYADPYENFVYGWGWVSRHYRIKIETEGAAFHARWHYEERSIYGTRLPADMEVYSVEGREFAVSGGQPIEAPGIAGVLGTWPGDIYLALQAGALGAQQEGLEIIQGRPASRVSLDMDRVDPAQQETLPYYPRIDFVYSRGTVWIDQETGGLLKAILDFEYDGLDWDRGVRRYPVHVEIDVSRIGEVTVRMP